MVVAVVAAAVGTLMTFSPVAVVEVAAVLAMLLQLRCLHVPVIHMLLAKVVAAALGVTKQKPVLKAAFQLC